jgi:hypothetical protein
MSYGRSAVEICDTATLVILEASIVLVIIPAGCPENYNASVTTQLK